MSRSAAVAVTAVVCFSAAAWLLTSATYTSSTDSEHGRSMGSVLRQVAVERGPHVVDVRNRKPLPFNLPTWMNLRDAALSEGLDPNARCVKSQNLTYEGDWLGHVEQVEDVWPTVQAVLDRNSLSSLCRGYNGTRIVLSSFLDVHYVPSFEAWALHLLQTTPLRLGCFVLVALDDGAASALSTFGVGSACVHVPLSKHFETGINFFKLGFLRQIAISGFGHLHVEQDVGHVKPLNPAFFNGEVDLACATWTHTLCTDLNSACNLGTLYVGPNAMGVLDMANTFFDRRPSSGPFDQQAFNYALKRYYYNNSDPRLCHKDEAKRYPFVARDEPDAPYRSTRSRDEAFRWFRVQVRPFSDDAQTDAMLFERGSAQALFAATRHQSFHALAGVLAMESFHMIGMTVRMRLYRYNEMGFFNTLKHRPDVEQALAHGFVTVNTSECSAAHVLGLLRVAARLNRTALLPSYEWATERCPAKVSTFEPCMTPVPHRIQFHDMDPIIAPDRVLPYSVLWRDSRYRDRILASTASLSSRDMGGLFDAVGLHQTQTDQWRRHNNTVLLYVQGEDLLKMPPTPQPPTPAPTPSADVA